MVLPVAKNFHVAAMKRGFVAGKTRNDLPWDSWQRPYVVVLEGGASTVFT